MQREIGALTDLLSHPGFLTGLSAGLVAGAVLFGVALVTRKPTTGWGLAFTAAVAVGMWQQFDVDRFALVAEDLPLWVLAGLPAVAVFGGVGSWLLGQSDAALAVGPLVAISVVGAWVTVPETDVFTVMVGVAIPMGLVTLRPIRARTSLLGSLALAGVFAWLVVVGGDVRPWTIAASWATLFTLPVFAVVLNSIDLRVSQYVMIGIHIAYIVVITRVADATDSTLVVTVAAVVLAALSGLVLMMLPSRAPELTDSPNRR